MASGNSRSDGRWSPGWWRRRPWSAVLAGLAAVALIAVGVVAGYVWGRSGVPGAAIAAVASPSASGAATPTSSATPLVTPSAGAGGTSPGTVAGSTATPTAVPTPVAQVSAGPPVFQAFTSQNCGQAAAANNYTCGTIVMAMFTGGGGAPLYTAQVTFANSSVVVGAVTDGKPSAGIVSQSGPTSSGFLVTMGQLSFPGAGTYPYTVTLTDTANAVTTTWHGDMPVGS